MNRLVRLLILIGLGAFPIVASAQNAPTAQLIIIAAKVNPTFVISPPTQTVPVGSTITYNITLTGSLGVPGGTVTLQAAPTGSTTFVNAALPYTLTNGAVTCTYVAPNSIGTYTVRAVYSGDTHYNAVTQ